MNQAKETNRTWGRTIVVAVDDPLLHPEVTHLVAASGHDIIDVTDPETLDQYAEKAFALLIDATWAGHIERNPHARNVFIVAASFEALDALGDRGAAGEHTPAFLLPTQAGDLLVALGELHRAPTPTTRGGTTIAVLGAGGGVGASVIACALAVSAVMPGRGAVAGGATLIDGHRLSGGLDLLLGIEEHPGARWGEIAIGEGAVARADLRRALPATKGGCAVLTFARSTVADPFRLTAAELDRVCAAVGTEGLTVLDIPVELMPARCDLAVIVVTPTVRSVCAASRLVLECNAAGIAHTLVLRDASWQGIDEPGVLRATGSRICERVPTLRRLPRAVDTAGLPLRLPKPLRRAADAILAEVA